MSECWLCITGKLKEGLEARSYRREIIFMYGTGNFALPLLQSWAAIDRQGFAHTIALMPEEKHCQKMLAFEPRFGCVWSTDTLPHAVWRHGAGARKKAIISGLVQETTSHP